MNIPTYNDVETAQERIKPYIHKTPVLRSIYLNKISGAELYFKCENFQKAGAFKARGASNAVFGLSNEVALKGVVTHSSGNHGLSLAYAAGRKGIPVTVVMPHTAPEPKKAAVRDYGGTIVECEPSSTSREETSARVVAESGADFVHPYNDFGFALFKKSRIWKYCFASFDIIVRGKQMFNEPTKTSLETSKFFIFFLSLNDAQLIFNFYGGFLQSIWRHWRLVFCINHFHFASPLMRSSHMQAHITIT